MHPYAAEARSQTGIYLALGAASVVAAWLLHTGLARAPFEVPWWVDTPSVLGFYALLWKAFDTHIWRWRFLHDRKWVSVPDIGDDWSVHLKTIYDDEPLEVEGAARIEQTWTRISIVAQWPNSDSHSVTAVLQTGPGARPQLVYTFVNEPRATAVSTMEMHRGTTWLGLSADCRRMEGHYYTGRGRQQVGEIVFQRVAGEANAAS